MVKDRTSITIERKIRRDAEIFAENDSRSFSSLVEIALKSYLRQKKMENKNE